MAEIISIKINQEQVMQAFASKIQSKYIQIISVTAFIIAGTLSTKSQNLNPFLCFE